MSNDGRRWYSPSSAISYRCLDGEAAKAEVRARIQLRDGKLWHRDVFETRTSGRGRGYCVLDQAGCGNAIYLRASRARKRQGAIDTRQHPIGAEKP
jgi:hypothetical protein